MRTLDKRTKVTRRRFLKTAGAGTAGIIAVVNGGVVMGSGGAWAMEVKNLRPESMATLVQMARDTYPHDHLADKFYAQAMIGYDASAGEDAALKAMLEAGVDLLDATAQARHGGGYRDVAWEEDRVAILTSIEDGAFFQKIRGGLITGLYNQPEVWAKFGYEGASAEKGGYISRGFDDIDWLEA
ncbi:MAG TPA: twin-arginine translocation signal domain-containing protein [Kiloniellaceae bacterium]|nr:twin-arginine translocation signal domain-containing protein [Kiloniellaceae bacterium]